MRRGSIPRGMRPCPAKKRGHKWHDPSKQPYWDCHTEAQRRAPQRSRQPQRGSAARARTRPADGIPRQRGAHDRVTSRDRARSDRKPARRVGESRRQYERRTNKEELSLQSEIEATAIEFVFDREGFYESLADRLIEQVPFRRRVTRNHWLCEQLNDTAEMLDPEKYRKLIGRSTRLGLVELGMPKYMANVIGAGAGFGVKIVLGRTPIGNISKVLRILIPLVCPDLNKCPTRGKVFSAFIGPLLTDTLKQIAEGASLMREAKPGGSD